MKHTFRRICVGTVTRNRPIMLEALLDSYAKMAIPAGTQLEFVIIENNETATLHDIVERFRAKIPDSIVQYDVEPRLGISFVRNRVLENAISSGCDLLTFADDDEVVTQDWLIQLLAERDASDLDIVGGPVRPAPAENVSPWGRMIWNSINKAMHARELASCTTRAKGCAGKLRIATNNWLGKLDFFRSTGVRFDETLGLNGGEDWRLYADAKKIGAKTGWAPLAIVHETIPIERLRLAYQFRRSRDHCAVEIRSRLASKPIYTICRLPGSILARLFKLIIQLAHLPFTPIQSLITMVAYLGSVVGMLQAFTPHHSPHYQKTTGH
ncbi:glycosyltransferase family 2 protein [Phyllobacterium sp. YR531]|uniref:glycosyltransferase family 2 protein n=1 Tax=Phyllobacterium sp. YR531 TaxID=1144343 RepID=UPI00026FC398|nr:glycosyltransferase family 2 protein [Phyllobacterium sp. YR531]EJN03553.1 putative glycosyltransferase [Phyllobacterium sp. YR531]